MAFRLSRLCFVFPSGARLCRWPQLSRQLQILPATSSHIHSLPGQLHVSLTPTKTTYFRVPLTNYSTRQRLYPIADMRQCLRSYSEGNVPESQSSKASNSSSISSSVSASQTTASNKALSSTERIKIILKEYGSVAFVFHISMSLCVLGVCYVLVSK